MTGRKLKRVLYWLDVEAAGALLAFDMVRWRWDARHIIAFAVAVPCYLLWILARLQLGKSFAARAVARRLVTTGLYSKIRNPIYFFSSFAIAGALVAWGNYIALIFFLVFVPLQLLRIRRGEQVLEQAFGEEYRQYKARTWF